MKKYKIIVEQIKEYEIEIDESQMNDEYLDEFEKYMFKLDEVDGDRLASLAYQIAWDRANDGNYEGIGRPLIKGKDLSWDKSANTSLNFNKIDEDYIDIDVEEI